MVEFLSGEEMAREVVRCFQEMGIGPGEALRAADFIAIAKRCGSSKATIGGGITWGVQRGWFVLTETNSLRLTETAFAAVRAYPDG